LLKNGDDVPAFSEKRRRKPNQAYIFSSTMRAAENICQLLAVIKKNKKWMQKIGIKKE